MCAPDCNARAPQIGVHICIISSISNALDTNTQRIFREEPILARRIYPASKSFFIGIRYDETCS